MPFAQERFTVFSQIDDVVNGGIKQTVFTKALSPKSFGISAGVPESLDKTAQRFQCFRQSEELDYGKGFSDTEGSHGGSIKCSQELQAGRNLKRRIRKTEQRGGNGSL
jgi:hypothetical protein